MAILQNENLFLLEFLVDDLKLEQKCDCTSSGELCVSFQFLDNEALDVCEADFNGDKKFGEDGTSKTGKSCLFSLTPPQAQRVLQDFDVIVTVCKKMRPGAQSDKLCVGTAKISVLPLFLELIGNPEAMTSAKILQETYNLIDSKGMNAGKIGVYMRMSCYGKMIITQFQMNMNDKSVLFKDKDGHSLYRYKKSKKSKTTKIEDLSNQDQCPPCCFPDEFEQPGQQMYQQMNQPMFDQNQFPPSNPNCPMTPCFPGGQGGFFPSGPNPMGPGGFPQMGPNLFPPMGQGGFPPSGPNAFPPSNMNCPMQPCFPPQNQSCPMPPCFPDYRQQDDICPAPSKACQQVSFSRQPAAKSGCGGCCGRG